MSQGRILPHSSEAETAILGAIMLDPEGLDTAAEIVLPEDFYEPRHNTIFQTMLDLYRAQSPIDMVSLAEALRGTGKLEAIGGGAYLAQLSMAEPTASHIAHHSKIVKDHSTRRSLYQRSIELAKQAMEPVGDIGAILDEGISNIMVLTESVTPDRIYGPAEIGADAYDRASFRREHKGEVTGLPTEFVALDIMTSGFQPSDLIIVAGRPSMGKTAFAVQCGFNASKTTGKPSLLFSLEMSKEQIGDRLLSMMAGVDSNSIRTGYFSDPEDQKLQKGMEKIMSSNFYIDDKPGATLSHMGRQARRLKKKFGALGLIIVDYLQLMAGEDKRGKDRRQEVDEISRGLKILAKELHTPVVAVSQLNRSLEYREDKRPKIADLRESGQIEQDADVILMLYRDEVYNENSPDKGIAEINLGKQRNGPTGTIRVQWTPQYTRFANLAQKCDGIISPQETNQRKNNKRSGNKVDSYSCPGYNDLPI